MQNDKTIVIVVVRFNVFRNMLPVFRRHIGGIHQRGVFVDGEVWHLRTVEFRHQCQLALQMTGNGNITLF
ncbi:hypothetical protein SDC9_188896 [bioreactor metagenome]|uniref:Uncharacterized protein n=1 Tax=bioreactor metagenome TaxID=1076179 RepID=A0A645HQL8_9ZZZZ